MILKIFLPEDSSYFFFMFTRNEFDIHSWSVKTEVCTFAILLEFHYYFFWTSINHRFDSHFKSSAIYSKNKNKFRIREAYSLAALTLLLCHIQSFLLFHFSFIYSLLISRVYEIMIGWLATSEGFKRIPLLFHENSL